MGSSSLYDIIILGSGPAGLTAAIYAGRAMLKTIVIGGTQRGGQLMLTSEVENYPGFPEGIQGPELMINMRKQAEKFGAEFVDDDASSVDFSSRPFKVYVGEEVYESRAVIIATGSSARWLGLDSEARLRGRGVSACAVCDGFFFRDKEVVVVGGGDSAIRDALFLTNIARKVYVIHRRDKLRAEKILQERAFKNSKIEFIWSSIVTEILGEEFVSGVKIKNLLTNQERILKCDGVFIAIGHRPNTSLFEGVIELDERGYIKRYGETRTNIEGVFCAGDVADPKYKQAITAAASGCKAAIDATDFLEKIP